MLAAIAPFVEQLQAAGIWTADESHAWYYRIPPATRPADEPTMAAMLVHAGKITAWQADELLARRGRQLLLGDYTLEERLGVGAMGQVYRARHRRMNRIVALKVLQPALARSVEMTQRFQREVQAAGRLVHPNIVAALDASEHDGQPFLVMEYVEGCNLAELVHREGPLPLRRALDYTLQAARGLEHAHSEGIVHRDIKPGNLLLDSRQVVKILDLGAARIENVWGEPIAADDEGLTHTGNILGTVDYMAPEQALNLRHADHRADIYSLGCTLYRLLTNQRLYPGETVLERILAHRELPVPKLSDARKDVLPELETLFQRMVAKRSEDRYPTVSDLIHDLEALLVSLPIEMAENALPSSRITHQDASPETVWADVPFEGVDSGEDEPVPVAVNAEQSLMVESEILTIATSDVERAGTRTSTPGVATSGTLPAANWAWSIVAVVMLLPLALLAFLPSSAAVTDTQNTKLEELLRRERFSPDPQFSERALERMRRELEVQESAWQQSSQQWRTRLAYELAQATVAGGFQVVLIPERRELISLRFDNAAAP